VHCVYGEHRQPWNYGAQAEKVPADAIRLRYSLAPYIYSYERAAYETAVGLVRPMFWEFPDDPALANETNEWMFGDYLLVAPVLEKGQTTQRAAMPEGAWYDYFDGSGCSCVPSSATDYEVNASSWTDFPLFVREGAIIPTQAVQ